MATATATKNQTAGKQPRKPRQAKQTKQQTNNVVQMPNTTVTLSPINTNNSPTGYLPAGLNKNNTQIPVSTTQLIIDTEYQRQFGEEKVKAMVENFDILKVFPVILSWRKDENKHYIVDGHHRIETYRRLKAKYPGFYDSIDAVVYQNLTREEEARMFVGYNKNRKPSSALETLKALIVSRDKNALDLQAVAEENGFSFGSTSSQDVIASLNGLQKLQLRKNGLECMTSAIKKLRQYWDGNPKSFNSELIYTLGIMDIKLTDKKTGEIVYNPEVMKEALKSTGIDKLVARKSAIRNSKNVGATEGYYHAIIQAYNKFANDPIQEPPYSKGRISKK